MFLGAALCSWIGFEATMVGALAVFIVNLAWVVFFQKPDLSDPDVARAELQKAANKLKFSAKYGRRK
jgi:hypothetical protein